MKIEPQAGAKALDVKDDADRLLLVIGRNGYVAVGEYAVGFTMEEWNRVNDAAKLMAAIDPATQSG